MLYKDNLIENMHKIFRADPWMIDLFASAGISLDDVERAIKDLENQYWFDTATWALVLYEKLLKITPSSNATIADRRSLVEAKWKSNGKCTLDMLKGIASSWKNGNADVKFLDGRIKFTFISKGGALPDQISLMGAVEEVKPAHLPASYEFILQNSANCYLGATATIGQILKVYPWAPKAIASKGNISIPIINNRGAQILTVYPKEG